MIASPMARLSATSSGSKIGPVAVVSSSSSVAMVGRLWRRARRAMLSLPHDRSSGGRALAGVDGIDGVDGIEALRVFFRPRFSASLTITVRAPRPDRLHLLLRSGHLGGSHTR